MLFGDLRNKKDVAKFIIGIISACVVIYLSIRYINVVIDVFNWVIDVVYPLLIGIAAALIINVPMSFLEKRMFKKFKTPKLLFVKRLLALIISILFIFGILVGVSYLVIPELIEAFKAIAKGINNLVDYFSQSHAEGSFAKTHLYKFIKGLNIEWKVISTDIETWINDFGINNIIGQGANVITTAFNTLSVILGGIINVFIGFVFSIYLLLNKNKLKITAKRIAFAWLPRKVSSTTVHVCSVCSTNFKSFVSGQFVEAIILGLLCTLGMSILNLPYAAVVGTMVGVLALIPIVGAFMGTFVGAFVIMTESPVDALIFVIFFLVLQQLEGTIIYPKVVGAKLNLPAIWVWVAVTIGANVGGALGMFLSVPIAASAYQLFKEATVKRESLHQQEFAERMHKKMKIKSPALADGEQINVEQDAYVTEPDIKDSSEISDTSDKTKIE